MLSGVASIKAQQSRMNVIGDNLANVNTTAFKGSRVSFAEMMSQTVRSASGATSARGGVNPIQYGLGVSVTSTDVNNAQGALNQTNKSTDLAIQGNGFFMTSNSQRMAYTRDGSFQVDTQGFLVQSATGERVLGWQGDNSGAIDTTQAISPTSYVSIPNALNSVKQTTIATFAGNLNSSAVPTDTVTSSMRVYDSQGGAHDLNVVLTNHTVPPGAGAPAGATSSWDWQVWEGAPGTGTLVGDNTTTGNERFYFDSSGNQISSFAAGTYNQVTLNPTASQSFAPFSVNLNFSQITQLNGASQINGVDQDGFAPGSLESFAISQDGVVTGIFTNGFTRPLAQIGMAAFSNPEGLERQGNNLYIASDNSGRPLVGTPRTNSRGTISAGFLEQSNVDIGGEFTDLIVTQRGFQANTKVVTTVDELLQDLINMKR